MVREGKTAGTGHVGVGRCEKDWSLIEIWGQAHEYCLKELMCCQWQMVRLGKLSWAVEAMQRKPNLPQGVEPAALRRRDKKTQGRGGEGRIACQAPGPSISACHTGAGEQWKGHSWQLP